MIDWLIGLFVACLVIQLFFGWMTRSVVRCLLSVIGRLSTFRLQTSDFSQKNKRAVNLSISGLVYGSSYIKKKLV